MICGRAWGIFKVLDSVVSGIAPIEAMEGGTNNLDEAIAKWNSEVGRREFYSQHGNEPMGGFG